MARRVTLDQLAQMIARGFEDVHRRLDQHATILGEHTTKLDGHTAVLESHTATLADHSHRLDRIERKLDNVVERVDDHDVRLQALERRRGPRR